MLLYFCCRSMQSCIFILLFYRLFSHCFALPLVFDPSCISSAVLFLLLTQHANLLLQGLKPEHLCVYTMKQFSHSVLFHNLPESIRQGLVLFLRLPKALQSSQLTWMSVYDSDVSYIKRCTAFPALVRFVGGFLYICPWRQLQSENIMAASARPSMQQY